MTPTIEYDDTRHKYTVNGQSVPSVTQILGVLNKPALPWWGMTIGVQGVCKLRALDADLPWDDPEGITKLLTLNKLTVNHVRDSAGTRGSSMHDALEAFMRERVVPNAADFPVEDGGYVQALARALVTLQPEPIATEVMVASAEHGFAGRYDLRARVGGRVGLIDLKSGKRIYDTAMMQLEAYELASVECEWEPTDFRAVLRVDASGEFEFVESSATGEQFLAVLSAFNAVEGLKGERKRAAKALKAAA